MTMSSVLVLMTVSFCFFFFFNDTPTTEIYTLSLHDALPISRGRARRAAGRRGDRHRVGHGRRAARSEEHTSELQSRRDLVCRLLLEKKKNSTRASDHPITAAKRRCRESSSPSGPITTSNTTT